MEVDDPQAMAALLATARELLRSRVQSQVSGEMAFQTEMIANAIAQVGRALEHPGTSWSALPQTPATVSDLRLLVARRLAVTNPRYAAEVADAPP